MQITNVQKVEFDSGETVGFFDIDLDYIIIKNCRLLKGRLNKTYYINLPKTKYTKADGTIEFHNYLQIRNRHYLREITELAKSEFRKLLRSQ